MKHFLWIALIGFMISCTKEEVPVEEPVVNPPIAPVEPKVYSFETTPAWFDEFDVNGLPNNQIWGYDVGGGGWGNNELQNYTANDLDNARVENGKLIVTAIKEASGTRQYSSARLVTKGKKDMKYGRVEIKAKVPAGLGSWPALWMLASQTTYGSTYWPDQGEIDIMEHVGFDPAIVHASVHTNIFNHVMGTQKTAKTTVPTFNSEFHVYRLDWTPDEIKAFIDDREFFAFKRQGVLWQEWPFNQPQHLLVNIAIGGNWGGQKGIDDSIFPISMELDYVRYYALKQ
ncbi:MAG: family 16 glycosylhydrolase [Chitinophagaceae bacterium]|jgi:beta-glucanase (GH16 family)